MPIPSRPRPWSDLLAHGPLAGQRGSMLIATVIAVTIVATLGTAIYSFVATSTLTQIGSMNDTKAYYLAESGGHYAIKLLVANAPSSTAACNTLLAGTYSVTNTGQFTLQPCTYTAASGFHEYRFVAKGTLIDNSTSRAVNYIVKVPSAAGVEIPFTGSGDTLDPNNWNVTGDADLDSGDDKVELNDGNADTQISLDWSNPSSGLPDLGEVWAEANGLLTYEAQVKVRLGSDHDVMTGISFRLNTQGDGNIANDSFYGLSFLWCKDHGDLPAFCGAANRETYIVLWRQAADGSQTLIGKQLARDVSPSLVVANWSLLWGWYYELVDWATLVVRVQEQINPNTLVRENLITAFAGVPATSPKGTVHWDYGMYTPVRWQVSFAGTDCSGGDVSCAADSTLTTVNFSTSPQDEIGLHTFGNEEGEVADLALRFNFAGTATSY